MSLSVLGAPLLTIRYPCQSAILASIPSLGENKVASRYFFDLPVYRLSAEQYYAERDAYIKRIIFRTDTAEEPDLQQREKATPRINDAFRNHLTEKYGGWEFNEIIGYIRLHFLGSQIRGEYFAVDRKRIVRTRTKTFEYKTLKLAPEIDIAQPCGTGEVLGAIQQYIQACKAELPQRFIDTSNFDKLAPHIAWGNLYQDHA
ncbi:MAG: hypothetical protein ABSG12_08955 [Steroidobacteraceae bacterium]